MQSFRVRFAPSPTGALHIGGVRTALYNYLLAKKNKGTFILRVEDTDQTRYVEGAEEYIKESLDWLGILPDEGPKQGGNYGPYRQSERREKYQKYAQELIERGHAYYAFDTPEELDTKREKEKEKGNHTFKYDQTVRLSLRNSLSLPQEKIDQLLAEGVPYTVRLKIPENKEIIVKDLIRGEVHFQSNELDDKVILKADGLPTYHLANIVDDHLMEISHVVRGEEWLPSTAHHVLMYQFFGWEATMPQFAHLPLILKPNGKGKLSKRDGTKLGIPVFPLSWEGDTPEESFKGFREFGFDPNAVINFLAFLGWNPGTEQEIFSLKELETVFSIDKIGKSGARFDFDKAKWYNEQYIHATPSAALAKIILPIVESKGHQPEISYLEGVCELLKQRVTFYPEFWEKGYYFFENVKDYDQKIIRKKWNDERIPALEKLTEQITAVENFEAAELEKVVKGFINDNNLKFGDIFPFLRIALSGTTKGPDLFQMMTLLGKDVVHERLSESWNKISQIAKEIS